jgi:hypothetical protein
MNTMELDSLEKKLDRVMPKAIKVSKRLILAGVLIGTLGMIRECSCHKGSQRSTSSSSNVPCQQDVNFSGGQGTYRHRIDLGDDIGAVTFNYTAYAVPDWFKVKWDGKTVINTGFVGNSHRDKDLRKQGYRNIKTGTFSLINSGSVTFYKGKSEPRYAEVIVVAPFEETSFRYSVSCPK